jgi:phosphatidylserine/phosphatidylglycerophosphate/cardiolipin synthase-like enzyme
MLRAIRSAHTSITFETFISVGSTNFDIRSIRLNDEASLNIYNSDFATQMTAVFEADLLAAEPYSLRIGRAVRCAKNSPKRFCYQSNRSFD